MWLRSAPFDLAFVLLPTLLTGLLAAVPPPGTDGGLPAFLLLVVVIDVAHVWSTLWRTWLDPEGRERFARLLGTVPLLVVSAAALVAALWPGRFWTVMAYVAAFHFVRQAAGIAMLYRKASGQSLRVPGARLEWWAVQCTCLATLAYWHVTARPFAWFVPGDFLVLPPWILPPVLLASGLVVGAHLWSRLRGPPNPGGDLWFLANAASWLGAVVFARSDLGFTLANVVGHGVPYLALVRIYSRRVPLALFLLAPVALALGEEALWDIFLWHEHLPLGVEGWVPVASAILAVPQLTHYVLDGYIWKERGPVAGYAA
ncbi:MAG: hypothetical protein FJ090_11380 [Deltaproteobacteria bacterium]|nr:hypothetical protein [Deltaproteobacteria bacterium]